MKSEPRNTPRTPLISNKRVASGDASVVLSEVLGAALLELYQAAPSDPPNAAHAAIPEREAADHFPGAVGGIVIDEDDFPGDAGKRRLQPPVQRGDVVALVEGGDDDRKLKRTWGLLINGLWTSGLLWVFGAWSDGFIHEGQRISADSCHAKAKFLKQRVEVQRKRPKTGWFLVRRVFLTRTAAHFA